MWIIILIITIVLLLTVPMLLAWKDKDFNKFMWNFRN